MLLLYTSLARGSGRNADAIHFFGHFCSLSGVSLQRDCGWAAAEVSANFFFLFFLHSFPLSLFDRNELCCPAAVTPVCHSRELWTPSANFWSFCSFLPSLTTALLTPLAFLILFTSYNRSSRNWSYLPSVCSESFICSCIVEWLPSVMVASELIRICFYFLWVPRSLMYFLLWTKSHFPSEGREELSFRF